MLVRISSLVNRMGCIVFICMFGISFLPSKLDSSEKERNFIIRIGSQSFNMKIVIHPKLWSSYSARESIFKNVIIKIIRLKNYNLFHIQSFVQKSLKNALFISIWLISNSQFAATSEASRKSIPAFVRSLLPLILPDTIRPISYKHSIALNHWTVLRTINNFH